MFEKITAFFISMTMTFLSVFGISFEQNEYGSIDPYYSDSVCKGSNEKTNEIKSLLSEVMKRTPQITECKEKTPYPDDSRIKAIYFDGEECLGKSTKIFAYIGFPENASASSPVPAMVLVHGGAGHAYAEWVKYWVDNGYAAISIDGFGQTPSDGEYSESTEWTVNPESHMTIDELSTCDKPIKEQWFYYYLTDIILANNILRADDKIKTDNIGITGISWGGIATSVVIGYDNRFKFAAPVYGCGFLDESSTMLSDVMKNNIVKNTWEPSLLLDTVDMPVLWIDGDDDPFFSADSATKTASVTKNASLTLIPSLAHGQEPAASLPEVLRFANEQNGIGNGNIKINSVSFKNGRAVLSLDIPDDVKNVKINVYHRNSPLEYSNLTLTVDWEKMSGIVLGNTASVKLPDEYEMLYFEVTGKTGSIFNSETIHASTGIYTYEQIKALNADVERLNREMLSSKINASINSDLNSGKVGGAEILVNQLGERVFDGVYGVKGTDGSTLQKNAIFRLASMTKPITAVALMIAADMGKVDLYADVSDYLDGYENMKVGKVVDGEVVADHDAKNSIKVYQLVSHTSGIGSGEVGEKLYSEVCKDNPTIEKVVTYLSDKPLSYDPGTDQEYSTAAYDVAARIIEVTTGIPYDTFLKEKIFDKLGMVDTGFVPTDEQWNRLVDIHDRTDDNKSTFVKGKENCIFASFPVTYFAAGAGLFSTAEDYMKFCEMLLNDGKAPNGEQVVSAEMIKVMSTPLVSEKIMSGSTSWGLGVRVIRGKNTLPIGSFGWSGMYGSHFWIDPVNKIAAVYMKNSLYDGGAGSATGNQFEEDVMTSLG